MIKPGIFAAAALLAAPQAWAGTIEEAHRLYFSGEIEAAVFLYGRVAEDDPKYPEALLNEAVALNQLGKPQEAIRVFSRFDRRWPKSAFVHREMGWCALALENYESAIIFFEKALSENPDNWESAMGLAWSYARENRSAQSLAVYQKTLIFHRNPAILSYLAGRLFERLGLEAAALTLYREALRKDYAMAEAKEAAGLIETRQKRRVPLWKRFIRGIPGSGIILRSVRLWFDYRPVQHLPVDISAPPPLNLAPAVGKKPAPLFRKKVSSVRVGLATDEMGRPLPWSEMKFFCASSFGLFTGKEPEKEVDGRPEEVWTIKVVEPGSDKPLLGVSSEKRPLRKTESVFHIVPDDPRATVTIQSLSGPEGARFRGRYHGVVEVHLTSLGLQVVNVVPVRDYVASVVPAEMIPWWPLEALKAQAVVSRSLAALGRLHSGVYDLCATVHCQVYKGTSSETAKVRRAAEATAGEVLTFEGRVVHAVFSSNCGGHTQGASDVGWKTPYIEGTSDALSGVNAPSSPAEIVRWIKGIPRVNCQPSENTYYAESRWVRLVPRAILEERIGKEFPELGEIRNLIIRRRGKGGHVNSLEVVGAGKSVTIDKEHRIRYLLAPGSLRSNLISIQTINEAGRPALFLIWGGGWGHGVGFCQSGAAGLAESGEKYKQILKHYYPSCRVNTLDL